jgi:hypothetical protein
MDYPLVHVSIMDCNRTHSIKRTYGDDVSKAIIGYYKNRGVTFSFGKGYASFQEDELNQKVATGLKTVDDKTTNADAFVMFPNNYLANTKFLERKDVWEDAKADTYGKLYTEPDSTVGNKMLFGAGSCTGFFWQPTVQKLDFFSNYRESINQGRIAAYNILGLVSFFDLKNYRRYLII